MLLQQRSQGAAAGGAAAPGAGVSDHLPQRAEAMLLNGLHDLGFGNPQAVTDDAIRTRLAGDHGDGGGRHRSKALAGRRGRQDIETQFQPALILLTANSLVNFFVRAILELSLADPRP
jgi:hypothetical protein